MINRPAGSRQAIDRDQIGCLNLEFSGPWFAGTVNWQIVWNRRNVKPSSKTQ
jgi:hypothetical protein